MAQRAAWPLAAIVGVGLLTSSWLMWLLRDLPDGLILQPPRLVAPLTILLLAYPLVGAVVVSRRPRNPIGWLLIAVGAAMVATFLPQGYAAYGLHVARLPGTDSVAWLAGFSWAPIWPLLLHVLIVFPDGRALSPRWRWLIPLSWTAIAVGALGYALAPAASGAPGDPPIGTTFPTSTAAVISYAGLFTLVGALSAAAAAVIIRFRRSRAEARQQMKWIAYAGSLGALGAVTSGVTTAVLGQVAGSSLLPTLPMMVGFTAVPFAVAIAVLRYRLYDIDVLINRTLVYATLSAILLATYVAAVVLLQAVLHPFTGGSDLAVAVSTLLVVALFQPIRRRVQDVVDRRFYRSRYDAARTLEAFMGRLRDEVEIDTVRADLLGVVGDTVRPAHASVWLREATR